MFENTSPPTIITVINIHQYTVQLVIFCLFYYWFILLLEHIVHVQCVPKLL